jgi:hypothetical protein
MAYETCTCGYPNPRNNGGLCYGASIILGFEITVIIGLALILSMKNN